MRRCIFLVLIAACTTVKPPAPATDLGALSKPDSGNDYAGKEHPELSSNGGKQIVVSYARGTGTFAGEVRLASVTLP